MIITGIILILKCVQYHRNTLTNLNILDVGTIKEYYKLNNYI